MRTVVTGSENADWLQDYCKVNSEANGKWFHCTGVQLAESGKGYLLSICSPESVEGPELCKAFVWKNSAQAQLIRDILSESYELPIGNPEPKQFPILMVQGTTTKQIAVGVEDLMVKDWEGCWIYSSRDITPGESSHLKKTGSSPANTRARRG